MCCASSVVFLHFYRFSKRSSRFVPAIAAERVTSVISAYQRRLKVMPFVPATIYRRATLGAKGFANKLLLVALFSDPDVGVQVLKDVGLIPSNMVCCKCGSHISIPAKVSS